MTCVVIGGGVIGVTLAYELQKRGRDVTVIDRDGIGKGASFGNMASIAVTEFMPASRPSVWRQMPKWLLDPEGPVRIKPTYAPRLAGWMIRFLMASRPSVLRRLEGEGAALCARALADTEALMQEVGFAQELSAKGCLSLYATEAEFKADRDHIEILERFGFDHEILDRAALRRLEPELTEGLEKAVLFPDNRTIADPQGFVQHVWEAFIGLGGQHVAGEVVGLSRGEAIHSVQLAGGRSLACDELVIAAGAFSARLSKLLDEPIPLETERGYHTQIMDPGIALEHSIIWPAKAFMVSPTAGGLRIGGTVEMAGLDAPPDYRRAKITVRRAKEALPNLRVRQTREWMGHRPALPDTVPVLSASGKTMGVYYSTGHGHLGLTNAATSARLMADLIMGQRPQIDLAPYAITRF